eukprot:3482813-Rhodomonas_salina.1
MPYVCALVLSLSRARALTVSRPSSLSLSLAHSCNLSCSLSLSAGQQQSTEAAAAADGAQDVLRTTAQRNHRRTLPRERASRIAALLVLITWCFQGECHVQLRIKKKTGSWSEWSEELILVEVRYLPTRPISPSRYSPTRPIPTPRYPPSPSPLPVYPPHSPGTELARALLLLPGAAR